MAYIDPEGMFGGDRMAMLPDAAKLAWPWFWCASNTVGRVELNYRDFVKTVFRQFKKPPTEQQFWDWVSDFHESYLLFVYEVDGHAWGQWFVSEKYLPHYKTVNDKRTPPPMADAFIEWTNRYQEFKRKLISGKCRVLSISEKFSDPQKNSEKFPIGEERRGEERITPAAGAAEEILFPETSPISEDSLLEETAKRICKRHPSKRTCGISEAKSKLKAIIKPLPRAERPARLEQIDANHQAWCATEDWTKEGGVYAKGLANWLAPTVGRYDVQPPSRASPKSGKSDPYWRPEGFDNWTLDQKTWWLAYGDEKPYPGPDPS